MKKTIFALFLTAVLGISLPAQTTPASTTQSSTQSTKSTEVKSRPPIFRANKEQIRQAQRLLRVPETGKMDEEFRSAIKKYQAENGLRATGTLNRATLEKMKIELTPKQKEIPVSPKAFAADGNRNVRRTPVFRATKEQITEAQKVLRQKGFYAGQATGRLDTDTRAALKTFQEANGLKTTGTLNQSTLKRLGIGLTEKQKEIASGDSQ